MDGGRPGTALTEDERAELERMRAAVAYLTEAIAATCRQVVPVLSSGPATPGKVDRVSVPTPTGSTRRELPATAPEEQAHRLLCDLANAATSAAAKRSQPPPAAPPPVKPVKSPQGISRELQLEGEVASANEKVDELRERCNTAEVEVERLREMFQDAAPLTAPGEPGSPDREGGQLQFHDPTSPDPDPTQEIAGPGEAEDPDPPSNLGEAWEGGVTAEAQVIEEAHRLWIQKQNLEEGEQEERDAYSDGLLQRVMHSLRTVEGDVWELYCVRRQQSEGERGEQFEEGQASFILPEGEYQRFRAHAEELLAPWQWRMRHSEHRHSLSPAEEIVLDRLYARLNDGNAALRRLLEHPDSVSAMLPPPKPMEGYEQLVGNSRREPSPGERMKKEVVTAAARMQDARIKEEQRKQDQREGLKQGDLRAIAFQSHDKKIAMIESSQVPTRVAGQRQWRPMAFRNAHDGAAQPAPAPIPDHLGARRSESCPPPVHLDNSKGPGIRRADVAFHEQHPASGSPTPLTVDLQRDEAGLPWEPAQAHMHPFMGGPNRMKKTWRDQATLLESFRTTVQNNHPEQVDNLMWGYHPSKYEEKHTAPPKSRTVIHRQHFAASDMGSNNNVMTAHKTGKQRRAPTGAQGPSSPGVFKLPPRLNKLHKAKVAQANAATGTPASTLSSPTPLDLPPL